MSRSVIVGAVVVVLGAIVAVMWTQSASLSGDEGDDIAPATQEAPARVPEAAEDAAGAAQDAVEDTTGAASDAAQEAASDAVETVEGALEAAEEAASNAAAAVSDAVEGAVPEGGTLGELLTVEGFDADAVLDAVATSDLGVLQKTGLSALVEEARNNPDLIESVISQVREALG